MGVELRPCFLSAQRNTLAQQLCWIFKRVASIHQAGNHCPCLIGRIASTVMIGTGHMLCGKRFALYTTKLRERVYLCSCYRRVR